MLKARDLMVRATAVCHPGESLTVAVRRMRERDCGILPVVNKTREVVGVLTDRDVCLAASASERPLGEVPVERAMSTGIRSVSTRADVEDVHDVMREYAVRRVPVLDDDHRLAGIISIDDLAARSSGDDTANGQRMSRMVTETLAALARRHAARVVPVRPML